MINPPHNYKASIAIPVYNNTNELKRVLTSLHNQTVESGYFEVILVDNGSYDHIKNVAKEFEGVTYLLEDKHRNSPYSCRNRGIEISTGEVIIHLDGTSIPEPDWLVEGLKCFEFMKADMISSTVRFHFREKVTAGKIYDSNNLKIKSSIKNCGAVLSAFLFVRKAVFDKVGLLPEGFRSGADLQWTAMATRNGIRLEYCSRSIAKKSPKLPGVNNKTVEGWKGSACNLDGRGGELS